MTNENLKSPEGFDWNAKADPSHEADNYFQGSISGELPKDYGRQISKALGDAFMEDTVECRSDAIHAACRVVAKILDEPAEFSRRDMLLVFAGFKMSDTVHLRSINPTDALIALAAKAAGKQESF